MIIMKLSNLLENICGCFLNDNFFKKNYRVFYPDFVSLKTFNINLIELGNKNILKLSLLEGFNNEETK